MKKALLANLSIIVLSVTAAMANDSNAVQSTGIDINDLGDVYLNRFRMVFLRMEPGTFQMGSNDGEWDEKPVHKVTISQPFYIMREEVTFRQYRSFDPTYPDYIKAVAGVSWHDAMAFAEWLSQLEGLPYRLPTEAEWEYVCRAGTTTPYSSGYEMPPAGTPNPWGISNMHNWPAEWVLDWHGEYSYEHQIDAMCPAGGIARVVRGGGLDDGGPYYMRSASRVGIAPGFGGREHLIGLRLVIGELPASGPKPYEAPFVRQCVKQSTGQQGPDSNTPYFNQRPTLPIPPENCWQEDEIQAVGLHPSFRGHNHSPGMEVCPNGDVLMIIYTSWDEYEAGVSLMATRLRFGSNQWDMPTPMFDFPGANDHAPMLWNDSGTLRFFWGCPRLEEVHPNPYPFQWTSSQDSGATWDEVKFPAFEGWIGSHSRQPINTALRGPDGTIYVSSDGGGDNSVLWVSSNNGQTWYDPHGRTGGRHTTFVLLNDGRILGMGGKNTNISGYMPKSISGDGGRTWGVSITPFSTLGTNQRPCIARLASGRLFFCSDFQRTRDCYQPSGITEKGALAALSEDEGETWLIKKIPTALPHDSYWCDGAPTLGYSVARQAANGIIHVITSMNNPCQHFEMNEAWILDPDAGGGPPEDPGEGGIVNQYQETYPSGALKTSWSAKTCQDGRYLLHGAETWYYENGLKKYEVTYYNGRKVGSETYWGFDGLKQWSWEHQADGTSVWIQWWPNGLKRIQSTWREGGKVAHGPTYHWSRCGMPEAAWTYIYGRMSGSAPLPEPQENPEPRTIYYVDADANGTTDGTSWADAFTNVQDALAAASGCDEIRVAEGVYRPDEGAGITPGDRMATFKLKTGLILRGGYAGFGEQNPDARDIDAYKTVLSGDLNNDDEADFTNNTDNCYRVVTGATALLDGFTITGGNAEGWGGGGMYNEQCSPTVTNCTFTGNRAGEGGGVWNYYSSPHITDCRFIGNQADYGGGMQNYRSGPALTNCTFSRNIAAQGGGMWNYRSDPVLTNCTFSENSANEGGGMRNYRSNPVLSNCTFARNSASAGGGMHNYLTSSPMVINCMFSANTANWYGGGIYNWDYSYPQLTNCTLSGNRAETYGGAMFSSTLCFPTLTNCILWRNQPDQIGGIASVAYSDIEGAWEGEGNIDSDPWFVEPGYWDTNGVWVEGDYHLLPVSPCIDAGDNYSVPQDFTDLDGDGDTIEQIPWDLDGNTRFFDYPGVPDTGSGTPPIVDLGAYEAFVPPLAVQMKFTPQALNPWSKGKWVKSHFVLPQGFKVEDVDGDTPCVLEPGGITSDRMNVFVNANGLVEIEASFGRDSFCEVEINDQPIDVKAVGRFTSGRQFYGTGTIKISSNVLKYLGALTSYWLEQDCSKPDWCGGLDIDEDSMVNLRDFALLNGCCIEVISK